MKKSIFAQAGCLLIMVGFAFGSSWLMRPRPEGEARSERRPKEAGELGKTRYLTKEIRAAYPGFVGQDAELHSGTERLNEEYRKRDDEDREESRREQRKAQIKADVDAEETWRSIPKSDCAAFGKGAVPQICLEIEGPAARRFGKPVDYRLRWRNMPKDAGLRVWVVNAALPADRWKYMGPDGAITPVPLMGGTAGELRLSWDGKGIACAPTDAPMLCGDGQIGSYLMRAAIVTGADPFHVGWPEQNPPPTRYLASSERPFLFDGPPQGLQAHFRDTIERHLPDGVRGRGYSVDRFGPWVDGWFSTCSRQDLKAPLAGSIEVCFPRSRIDRYGVAIGYGDLSVDSDARLAQGIMSHDDAVTRAIAYGIGMAGKQATFPAYPGEVDMVRVLFRDPKAYDGNYSGLRDTARDARLSYVDVDQPHVTFRDDDAGSWWLAQFQLRIATIDGQDQADLGRVALRIDHDGRVCRITPGEVSRDKDGNQQQSFSPCMPGSQKRIVL